MALLRDGAMGTPVARPYAPSTLGSFLRAFTFAHVRQLDALATRLLAGLHEHTPLLAGIDGPVMVDLDDNHHRGARPQQTGIRVRQLRGRVRGLSALIATLTTDGAPW